MHINRAGRKVLAHGHERTVTCTLTEQTRAQRHVQADLCTQGRNIHRQRCARTYLMNALSNGVWASEIKRGTRHWKDFSTGDQVTGYGSIMVTGRHVDLGDSVAALQRSIVACGHVRLLVTHVRYWSLVITRNTSWVLVQMWVCAV